MPLPPITTTPVLPSHICHKLPPIGHCLALPNNFAAHTYHLPPIEMLLHQLPKPPQAETVPLKMLPPLSYRAFSMPSIQATLQLEPDLKMVRRTSLCWPSESTTSDSTQDQQTRSKTRAPKKICTMEGCSRASQRSGLCHRHGGKRFCNELLCFAKDRGNGYCIKHGGGRCCEMAGCLKRARRQGLCTQHFRQENGPTM
jgi:hypothetical protein